MPAKYILRNRMLWKVEGTAGRYNGGVKRALLTGFFSFNS
jgi:hypothetical protein